MNPNFFNTIIDHLDSQEIVSLDGIIVASGIGHGPIKALDIATKTFEEHLIVNVKGPLELINKLLPFMQIGQLKKIIVFSSVSALVDIPMQSAYCLSKKMLDYHLKKMSVELRSKNVYLTTLRPGLINTELVAEHLKSYKILNVSDVSNICQMVLDSSIHIDSLEFYSHSQLHPNKLIHC